MMVSILIPHWKTGKMTAYTVSQLLKYKGKYEVEIIVIDNNAGDSSVDYLFPFVGQINYIQYPKDKLQSHGIAFDYALELGFVSNEYFITIESDSFPVKENWLDYYEKIINEGYDMAGSKLKLSGGQYIHPCGAMYSKKLWQEAKDYCSKIQYAYFPNAAMKNGFPCHLMVHNSILDKFIENPDDYVEAANGYSGSTPSEILEKRDHYLPVLNPFHNGVGVKQETLATYGSRTIESEKDFTLLDNKAKLVYRMGAEPGQWLTYYAAATEKKMFEIPTETKWMIDRENQQQEYTEMENGFRHLWGVSAYHKANIEGYGDVIKFKENQVEELYNSLPEHQKIKK